ncbi:rer1 family-like protein [Angomonas deanei]|nr:rer1 family-like protein [Angomonas deanei]|eukprot:EPY41968.1 rer1 family-like protein [Angomonas deanei]
MRWVFFAFACLLYIARVSTHEGGFYVITYGLCIHLLFLLLMLITPDSDLFDDGPVESLLSTKSKNDPDEFRPFMPKMQEFTVWHDMFRAVLIALFLTMFNFLDIPVFWPILVIYFILLFSIQMGGRVKHMIKHGYVPWDKGKPKFVPKTNV